MARPTADNRQRRWAPKVRSGCFTCKKRRKKCDEQRPFCQNCIKGKYVCDGYPTDRSESSDATVDSAHLDIHNETVDATPLDLIVARPTSLSEELFLSPSACDEYYSMLAHGSLTAAFARSDQRYAQFFVVVVAPILASTKQWRSFWESTVPCISTHDSAIYHAMIALSASYESKVSYVDRKDEAMSQVNLSLRSALTRPGNTSNTLILCRLLASYSQSTGDWKMATTHLQHGWKILKEAVDKHQIDPAIARLLAPTFLCASADQASQIKTSQHISEDNKIKCESLENVRSQYMSKLSKLYWNSLDGPQKSFLLISWSIMTQTICSLIFPDTPTCSTEGGSVSVQDIRENLAREGALYSLDELCERSPTTLKELEVCLQSPNSSSIPWSRMSQRFQQFVENFLVLAAEIDPTLNVKTFWANEKSDGCDIVNYVRNKTIRVHRRGCHGCMAELTDIDNTVSVDHEARQQTKGYYLEFVCPYRSGLMPAFIDQTIGHNRYS